MYRLFILLLVVLIYSCGEGLIKKEIKNEDGIVVQVLSMDRDSALQGESITYYDDGEAVFEKAHYENGMLNGTREIYYTNGNVEIREKYEDDILIDTLYTFYPSGVVKNKLYYRSGTLTGTALKYYESGSLEEEVTFEDDQENGPFVEYYENGQKKWVGTYLNGSNEYGELIQFDSTGQMIKRMVCDERAICSTVWTLEKGDIVPDNG